jgi:hypothetical protein
MVKDEAVMEDIARTVTTTTAEVEPMVEREEE